MTTTLAPIQSTLAFLHDRASRTAGDSPHAAKLASYVGNVASATNSLYALKFAENPYETSAAREKKVLAAAGRLDQHLDRVIDKANADLRTGITDIEARILEKTRIVPGKFDVELRALYRDADLADKIAALQRASETGDQDTLAALLLAPPALTGIPADVAAKLRECFEAQRAPEEVAERTTLLEVFGLALDAAKYARKGAREISNPLVVARANADEEVALNAAAAFNSSIEE